MRIRKMSLLSEQKGFSLIEAIVTVAIVGVIVAPIAMIFQGALESTMETRSQLKANQLAQQYVEAFKSMEFSDLKSLSDQGGLIDSAAITNFKLPEVIEGLSVKMKIAYDDANIQPEFGKSTDSGTNHDYKMPSLSIDPIEGDIYLQFNNAGNNYMDLYSSSALPTAGVPVESFGDGATSDRQIRIQYDNSSTGGVKISVLMQGETEEITIPTPKNRIVILCNDVMNNHTVNTNIDLRNYSTDKVEVYVFETKDDKIQPTLQNIGGLITVHRGLSTAMNNSHRIYEIQVEVLEDTTVLAKVVATVLPN